MKILLLGKNGQVGWELQRSLAPLGELVALGRDGDAARGLCGDLLQPDGLRETVRALKPDVVVNAAAYTAVDKAESEPDLARLVNTLAPAALAEAAQATGALLVHYSTDYVFDGSGHTPWVESAPTGPLNVYGQTKLDGERAITAACPRHLVLRTSWVYAARGNNFPKTMLRLAAERERLTVVDDQHGAPTSAELIADVTAHAIRQMIQRPQGAGTYHLAATGETSWFGCTQHILAIVRAIKPQLALAVREVAPVPAVAYPTPAQRPYNSRLDTSLSRQTFGLGLPQWQEGIARMLAATLGPSKSSTPEMQNSIGLGNAGDISHD